MIQNGSDDAVLDQKQAAEFCRMSAKTLERRASEGADLGRVKAGRRVIYFRSKLKGWLESLASSQAQTIGTVAQQSPSPACRA